MNGWSYNRLDPIVAARMIQGKEISAPEYLSDFLQRKRLRYKVDDTLKDIDALLVPTTMIPALPTTEVDADMDVYQKRNLSYLRNTVIGNILNLCGLSFPCGFTTKGLPIGLMIYGKPFREDVILRAGYAFEQATEWLKKTRILTGRKR